MYIIHIYTHTRYILYPFGWSLISGKVDLDANMGVRGRGDGKLVTPDQKFLSPRLLAKYPFFYNHISCPVFDEKNEISIATASSCWYNIVCTRRNKRISSNNRCQQRCTSSRNYSVRSHIPVITNINWPFADKLSIRQIWSKETFLKRDIWSVNAWTLMVWERPRMLDLSAW